MAGLTPRVLVLAPNWAFRMQVPSEVNSEMKGWAPQPMKTLELSRTWVLP